MASLNKWAKDALTAQSDNPASAARWLVKQALRKTSLRTDLLRLGADQLVRNYYRDQRAASFRIATGRVVLGPDTAGGDRVSSRIARRAFWDTYTLFGMTPIREATKIDLLASAKARATQASGELRHAAFERAVAVKLKNDRVKVSEAMTDIDLQKIAAKHASET